MSHQFAHKHDQLEQQCALVAVGQSLADLARAPLQIRAKHALPRLRRRESEREEKRREEKRREEKRKRKRDR